MVFIDSHCHLDFPAFDADRSQLLAACHKQHVTRFVVPGVTAERWPNLMSLVDETPGMYGALGLHPMFMAQHQTLDLLTLEQSLSAWSAVAVGEIGLDFYSQGQGQAQQIALFEAQLYLAKSFRLPVILHVRKAHDQVLRALRRIGVRGGLVHAFSGSEQQAHQYIALGFVVGVGGAITYSRAKRLRRTLSSLPLQALVLESDAPDMMPANWGSERNTPLSLLSVATVLADLFQVSVEDIAQQTSDNVQRILDL